MTSELSIADSATEIRHQGNFTLRAFCDGVERRVSMWVYGATYNDGVRIVRVPADEVKTVQCTDCVTGAPIRAERGVVYC
jgi:hypothetical protein